jgi:hypothetical protein
MHQTNTTKTPVNRTCRVRFSGNGLPTATIYCSSQIISQIKSLVVMLRQNIYVPKKGKNNELVKKLAVLTNNDAPLQEHINERGRLVISTYFNSII